VVKVDEAQRDGCDAWMASVWIRVGLAELRSVGITCSYPAVELSEK
jgi:hypothetical protein